MSLGIRTRTSTATLWSGAGSLARAISQFIVTVGLARLLTPADFGTIALLSVFLGLAGVFVDSGFSAALVQKKELDDSEMSAVLFFGLATSLAVSLALCLGSPFIASFFGDPRLRSITCVLGGTLVVGAMGSVHSVILSRRMDFRSLAAIDVTARVLSGALAIGLAWLGWGVWSLAAQAMSSAVLTSLLLWNFDPWRPTRIRNLEALRPLFAFGGFLLGTNLLNAIFERINSLLIGRIYSTTELGIYSRADSTQQLPTSLLTETINRVAFPLFSATQGESTALREQARAMVGWTMFLNLPAMAGLIAISDSLVPAVFGVQWTASVPYLRVLALAGALAPVSRLNGSLLVAQGQSSLYFRIEAVKKIFGVCALLAASTVSVSALAWSQVGVAALSAVLLARYAGETIQYPLREQVRDLLPYALVSVVMAVGVHLAGVWLDLASGPKVIVQIILGATTYVVLAAVLRLSALSLTLSILRRRRALGRGNASG